MDGTRPAKPKDATTLGFTPELWEIIEQCWLADPNARPTLEAVLSCLREAAPRWYDRGEGAESVTSESVAGTIESSRSGSQRSTDCDGSLSDKYPANRMEVRGEAAGELFAGDETAVEEVLL